MKSILQNKKECYFSRMVETDYVYLDKHHIFYGTGNRKISEQNGFWVWLEHLHHIQDSPFKTPHNDKKTDLYLKRKCQEKFEETHTRNEFMSLIGRNYLEEREQ